MKIAFLWRRILGGCEALFGSNVVCYVTDETHTWECISDFSFELDIDLNFKVPGLVFLSHAILVEEAMRFVA